jgi:iron complex outermembrane receptor protein
MLLRNTFHSSVTRTLTVSGVLLGANLSGAQTLDEVKVQGGRIEQRQFDTPASVQVIDEATIRSTGAQVNLSDTLGRVPGVVSLNRNNYAQDVQISIRGFGARAPFGLRGIRLITDGIPATIPDGQGQATTASLTSASRIEVLTGPLAQLYGNSSGGVIQTFTREAGATPEASTQIFAGTYGLTRTDWQVSGRAGAVGIVADYSNFGIEGYRVNSSAQRKQLNTVMTVDVKDDTKARFILNSFDMPYAKDPLGLTSTEFNQDASKAGTGAEKYFTRKAVAQNQLGTVLEHKVDKDLDLMARVYTGDRQNLQYQVTTTGGNAAFGAWTGLNRNFYGTGLQAKGRKSLADGSGLDWVIGMDYDSAKELRRGGTTLNGQQTAVINDTRNELNKAMNRDFFAQLNWHLNDKWTFTSGARNSKVILSSKDNFYTSAADNGSGEVAYKATSPVLGLTFHANDDLNLYVNTGNGFETPTLSEVAYDTKTVGPTTSIKETFNTKLSPSKSHHQEAGLKWKPSSSTQLDAALFHIYTDNELTTLLSSSGKTAYQNASKTNRDGLEFSFRQAINAHWRTQVAFTWMTVTYEKKFSTINVGNALPGIPQRQFFGNLTWTQNEQSTKARSFTPGMELAADLVGRTKIFANDLNTAAAPGYSMVNIRAQQKYKWGAFNTTTYVGVDNLFERKAVGSVIVNQASSQFFEPAMPLTALVGIQASLPF